MHFFIEDPFLVQHPSHLKTCASHHKSVLNGNVYA